MKNNSTQIIRVFEKIEIAFALVLSIIILLVATVALISIVKLGYELISNEFMQSRDIEFSSYSLIFARMITLLISLEFMNSILKILKTRDIKVLAGDVVLITVLALCRKLIVLDYKAYEPLYFFGFALLLFSLGFLWFVLSNKSSLLKAGKSH